MTRIKHIIATRFLSSSNNSDNRSDFRFSDETLLSDEMIKTRLQLLSNNLLQSLKNQSNQEFEFVLIIHNRLPDAWIKKIKKCFQCLNISFDFSFVRNSQQQDYLKTMWDKFDKIIVSRIDDDDLIYNDAVNEIQNIAKCHNDICVYGYTKGYTYVTSNPNTLYGFYHEYNNSGTMSIFQSVIYNSKLYKFNQLFSLYAFNHTKVKNWLTELEHIGYKTSFIQNNVDDAFIYYRHSVNVSHRGNSLPRMCRIYSKKMTVEVLKDLYEKFSFNQSDF